MGVLVPWVGSRHVSDTRMPKTIVGVDTTRSLALLVERGGFHYVRRGVRGIEPFDVVGLLERPACMVGVLTFRLPPEVAEGDRAGWLRLAYTGRMNWDGRFAGRKVYSTWVRANNRIELHGWYFLANGRGPFVEVVLIEGNRRQVTNRVKRDWARRKFKSNFSKEVQRDDR